MSQAIVLELPEDAYQRAERIAMAAHADIQVVLLNAIREAFPPEMDIPGLEDLAPLTDEQLVARVSAQFNRRRLADFDRLRRLQEERPLTTEEQARLEALREAYQQAELEKARAAAVLALRKRFCSQP